MARPVRSSRGPSTTMLFRITIQRPRGTLRRGTGTCPVPRRGRLRKRVCFSSSRRSMPPFFLFMERHRRRLRRRYPNVTMVQMAKRLGRMWQRLPEEDKEVYKDLAERIKYRRVCRSIRSRSRSKGLKMCSRRKAMKNLMISFTTKAASLRNFLLSYL